MIQLTEPATSNRRLEVDETEKVSSTICRQDRGRLSDRVDSDRLAASVALLPHWINRESFLATGIFEADYYSTSY
jgi:hypothetical protein